ncbi:EAL domain-containing protein [Solwaraspora sp. WMMA2056]|uniref:putative bifunctional diguanylate cyclase/phosphodiesterase n=1 Tax=Solwaraspora sp. WMMA2056 TaxID=3015161 RepID=UPI00259B1882|nr:EAL domain-containing protein [Solwaraspora sp. WMMA2056]WJK40132.1 EAL domain-containing protein [Solwaraspora sp. WMMA2056]
MEAAALRNSVPPERAPLFFGYVGGVTAAAVAVCAVPLITLPAQVPQLPVAFWLMAALAVVGDARPFTPPGRRRRSEVFPSVCFTFAILLAWGLGPAVAVQAVAVTVFAWRARHVPWRALFNSSQYALALAAAALVAGLAGPGAFAGVTDLRWIDVAVAVGAAAAWSAVNYSTVTLAIRLRFGGRWWRAAQRGVGFELLSTGSLLLLGPVLVVAAQADPALIPLVLVPLYAVYRMAALASEQERSARLDPLTGLANRKALIVEIADQVPVHAEARRRGAADAQMALLLLDLDRFKHVNDALGHLVGDRLLVEVGLRLAMVVRPQDLVVRLGGDEFAILATRLTGADQARDIADQVVTALAEPVALDGLPLDVGGSVGIALYPEHGEDFATLLQHADVAMYDAKDTGDGTAVYAAESDHNSPERLGLLADLRRVLDVNGAHAVDPGREVDDVGEITMYYQPQVEVATGEVVGVEALLRWRHPRRGMVDPEELIKVAEQSAVMRLLTRRVVDDVVEQIAKWAATGISLRAAVNVSVRDLHTGEIADQIADRLTRYNLPPDQLQLEITEGALMADPRRVLATISRLDAIGVAIALDDFGTGYSSMQHLRRLPLSEVKVDRSFVLGMSTDTDDAAIVRSVIELARALGLRVVAEGVEDEASWRRLHALGCHVAQGWFYARPMPADELVSWLARYRPLAPGPRDDPAAPGDDPAAPGDEPSDDPPGPPAKPLGATSDDPPGPPDEPPGAAEK